ncbi:MAG: ArnT family glycosyltransferase [Candidatus Xenobia bacterium]
MTLTAAERTHVPTARGEALEGPARPPDDRLWRWMPAIIFAVFAALALWHLGDAALWDNDESTYAEIAREFLTTGDWVTLHFKGDPWFCHPPLYYWMVALCFKWLGCTETAARLPSALFGAASLSVLYLLGRQLQSPRAGLLAAVSLGLTFQWYMESRMALLDTPLHFFLILTLLGMWLGLQGSRRGWWLMFAASGLAVLSKGPFGWVFPIMVCGPYIVFSGQWRRLREVPWLGGWALALALGGTWYAVETVRWGRQFFDTVFVYFALKRMTIKVQGQGGPWWLYFAITGAGLFPWSFFLPGALRSLWRERKTRDAALFVLVATLVPFVFFTIATTKLPNYAVFAYYGAALSIGMALDRMLSVKATVPTAILLVAAAFVAGLLASGQHNSSYTPGTFVVAATVSGIMVAASLLALFWPRRAVAALAVGMASFLLACTTFLAPLAETYRPIRPLARVARQELAPGDVLAICGLPGEFSLIFYTDHSVQPIPNEGELVKLFNSTRRVEAIVSRPCYEALVRTHTKPVHFISSSGNAVLISNV